MNPFALTSAEPRISPSGSQASACRPLPGLPTGYGDTFPASTSATARRTPKGRVPSLQTRLLRA